MVEDEIEQDRIETALDRIESWSAEQICPGTSVAITDGHDVLAQRGFGHRKLNPEEPATGTTQYAVGSVAKPVTALATLILDARGRIDVRDPVAEYTPYFENAPGDPITVHELLSHTSGMPNDDIAFTADELDGWYAFREFLDETTDRRRLDRERCLYYNSGYAVLSRLVEAVAGTEFPLFVEREIFEPLGMDRSTFDSSVIGTPSADVMTPYAREDGELREEAVLGSRILNGPGGLVTSVGDLATFLQAQLGSHEHLNDVPLERMREPVGTLERFVDGTERAYGYGWEIRPFDSDTLISHSGNTGVSAGFAGFLAERGTGIAIGCNAVTDPGAIARETLAILTGRDPEAVDPVKSIEREVQRLAGRYESHSGNHHATVSYSESGLDLEFGGGVEPFEIRVLPTDLRGDTYQFTEVDQIESTTDVEFFVNGETVELLFEGLVFPRVEEAGGDDRRGPS